MDLDADALHTLAAYTSVLLGVAGPVAALVYSIRVSQRDFWRRPMMVAATLAWLAVLGAYVSGSRLVDAEPRLLGDPQVAPHLEYADRLLLPGTGFFVLALLTGFLNPRTGALRLMLPMLLSAFAVVVLALILLSGDAGMRELWDRVREAYQ